jgi:molybdopterin molybdotransferase
VNEPAGFRSIVANGKRGHRFFQSPNDVLSYPRIGRRREQSRAVVKAEEGNPLAGVSHSWRTIESVLWENAHSVYRALRKPASDAQIARLAKLVPIRLPRDFVRSLKIHDGLRHSHLGRTRLFDYNALLPVSAIIDEYRSMCSLQTERELGGAPAGGDPVIRNDAHWRPGWLPIMDADGNKLVLDLDPAPGGTCGQVFQWYNTGSTPQRVQAPSFGQWLAELAEAFGKRRFRLDQFGRIWLSGVPNAETR